MGNKTTSYTEYAVEVNDDKGFVKQIDIFDTYEQAVNFVEKYDEPLTCGQYLSIIFIDYDENGDEIQFGTIC